MIHTTIMVPVPVQISIEENGEVTHVSSVAWDDINKAARVHARNPDVKKVLAALYKEQTKSRLDEGLVRIWVSHIGGNAIRYAKLERTTANFIVINGTRYRREDGRKAGDHYSAEWIDKDDLQEIKVREGAKSLLGMPGIMKRASK